MMRTPVTVTAQETVQVETDNEPGNAKEITGVFVSLRRAPLRVVFRCRVDHRRDVYEVLKPWDKIEAVYEVIRMLSTHKNDFVQRIVSIDERYYSNSTHRTWRYLHTDRARLYPGRDDLARYSHKINDLWIGTNLNTSGILQVIKEACEAGEVEYGSLGAIKW
jgi:hypothetical protein